MADAFHGATLYRPVPVSVLGSGPSSETFFNRMSALWQRSDTIVGPYFENQSLQRMRKPFSDGWKTTIK